MGTGGSRAVGSEQGMWNIVRSSHSIVRTFANAALKEDVKMAAAPATEWDGQRAGTPRSPSLPLEEPSGGGRAAAPFTRTSAEPSAQIGYLELRCGQSDWEDGRLACAFGRLWTRRLWLSRAMYTPRSGDGSARAYCFTAMHWGMPCARGTRDTTGARGGRGTRGPEGPSTGDRSGTTGKWLVLVKHQKLFDPLSASGFSDFGTGYTTSSAFHAPSGMTRSGGSGDYQGD